MKTYILYLLTLLSIFGLYSCDNFLSPEPTDKYSENVAFASENNAKLYVNSFYPILSNYGLFGSGYLYGCVYLDGLTDIEKAAGSTVGWNGAVSNLYATTPSLITADQNSLDIWSNAYYYIRLVNQFLKDLEGSNLDNSIKSTLSAEACFFRGYLYFLLVRNYGGVILLSEPTQEKNHARNTESECWDFISKDLLYAASNLPRQWKETSDYGRITKGAAFAMESRAMLYAERWQDAYNAADSVLSMVGDGTYALNKDYAKAFGSYYKDGNKESVLEYNYLYPNLIHNYDAIVSPGGDNIGYGGDIQPTQELVEMYEKAGGGTVDWSEWHKSNVTSTPPWSQLEPRFQASVLYNGCVWKGRTIQPYVGGADGWSAYPPASGGNKGATETGYYVRKYVDETHTDLVNVKSSQPWIEMRLAEVYLNFSEAAYHLSKISEANAAINTIRARVGLPNLNLSGDAMFRQIKKERVIELAFEGQRYWDLRRWKDATNVLNGIYVHGIKVSIDVNGNYTYDYISCDDKPRQFPDRFYAFPILSSELENNSLCTQNTGW